MKFQRGLEPIARGARRTLLGLGALSIVSGKLAYDFNLTSSRIVGLAGVGERQVDSWKDALLELAPVVGKAPRELSEALYFVTSSGVDASKALGVVDKAARASAAGLGETQVVADAVTSAMNAYAKENLSAAQATDILVATVREGKGEASEIAPVLGNVVPIASQLGVGFNEVGAAIAAMTRLGFDAATAATNLSGVFNALLKPAKDAKEALSDVGLSAGEVREMLAQRGLLPTLQLLEDRFKGNEAAIARVFRDVRGFRAVLALVGKAGEGTAEVFKAMEDNTGALGKAFGAIDEDALAFQQSLAEMQAEGIKLGQALLPVGAAIVGVFADVAGVMGENRTATLAAAAVIGTLSAAIIVANTALKIYNSQLVAATIGQGRLLAIGAAASPIGAAALAVAGLTAALILLADGTSETERAMREATDAARAYKTALDELKGATGDHKDAVLAVKRAEIELERAQKTRRQTIKDYGKGSLEARDANLRLKEAVRALERAQDRESETNQKVNDTRRRVSIGAKQAREDIENLRDTIHRELSANERAAVMVARHGRQIEGLRTRKAAEDAAEFAQKTRELAGELGGSETKAGRAALAVADLVSRLDRMPTRKEVDFALNTAEAYSQLAQIHDRITDPVYMPVILRPAGTTGIPRQHGGPVMPGRAYIVGEKRPELLVMGRGESGYVHPSVNVGRSRSGGQPERMELVITNWEEGRGYVRRVADGQDIAHARRARQRQRMGA